MLVKRKKEKIPGIRRLIKELKEKIFDQKFSLFKDALERDQNDLQDQLIGIFGNFENLGNSDYLILNTYYKEIEDDMGVGVEKVNSRINGLQDEIERQRLQVESISKQENSNDLQTS